MSPQDDRDNDNYNDNDNYENDNDNDMLEGAGQRNSALDSFPHFCTHSGLWPSSLSLHDDNDNDDCVMVGGCGQRNLVLY